MSFHIIEETEENTVSLKETENVLNVLNEAVHQDIHRVTFEGDCDRDSLKMFLKVIGEFLLDHELDVRLVLNKTSCRLFEELERFADRAMEEQSVTFCQRSRCAAPLKSQWETELENVVNSHHEMSFQQKLLSLIDEKKMTDVEVYKRADLDRKLFSKIRCNEDYRPSKKTILALAIALKLDMEETEDLLSRAEYALSPFSKADLIVEYFIRHENYNIYELKVALYEYGLIQ